RRGAQITFVGTPAGIEGRAVPAAGFALRLIPGAQVRGGGPVRAVRGVGATIAGVVRAASPLRARRAEPVGRVGGSPAAATVVAARLAGLPIVLLEQNTVPGIASRALGRLAGRVCLGFAEAASFFPAGRVLHTGNPVRASVLAAGAESRDAP